MSNPRDLAAQIAAAVFDHVEHERTFVRHRIEDVICDTLMLEQAKQQDGVPMTNGYQTVLDQAAKLVRLLLNDISLQGRTPMAVCGVVDDIHRALRGMGWHP